MVFPHSLAEMILRLSLFGNQHQPTGHWFSCQMPVMSLVTGGREDQRGPMFFAISFRLLNETHLYTIAIYWIAFKNGDSIEMS